MKTIFSNSQSDPEFDIEGQMVPVRIRRNPRARNISLRVDAVKGEIKVTLPTYAPTAEAMAFIEKKQQWIATRLETAPKAIALKSGNEVAVNGHAHIIDWREGLSRNVKQMDGILQLGGPEDMVPQRIIRWLKALARKTYMDDIAHYCGVAGENIPRLQLGDQRSRWGSCSTRGTIALNWRLIMAPEFVRRSVIAHEVAHMRHMDHSPAFYAWMDEIFEGDRKAADAWLKMHGSALHLVGA